MQFQNFPLNDHGTPQKKKVTITKTIKKFIFVIDFSFVKGQQQRINSFHIIAPRISKQGQIPTVDNMCYQYDTDQFKSSHLNSWEGLTRNSGWRQANLTQIGKQWSSGRIFVM